MRESVENDPPPELASSRILARAAELRRKAAEYQARAADDANAKWRHLNMAAATAYTNWAVEIERVALTIQRFEDQAGAAAPLSSKPDQLPENPVPDQHQGEQTEGLSDQAEIVDDGASRRE